MAALTADLPRAYASDIDPVFAYLPCVASDTSYEGGAIADNSGAGAFGPLAAAEAFAGFCEQQVTNGTTAGANTVKVRQRGIVKNLAVTGVTGVTDHGITVYATTDNTFTTTASGASSIGKVVRYVSTGVADVYFEGAAVRSL